MEAHRRRSKKGMGGERLDRLRRRVPESVRAARRGLTFTSMNLVDTESKPEAGDRLDVGVGREDAGATADASSQPVMHHVAALQWSPSVGRQCGASLTLA